MSYRTQCVLWFLVGAALLLTSCGVVTALLRGAGVPVGDAADDSARKVDAAVTGWLFDVFGVRDLVVAAAGATVSEGTRAAVRVRHRRKAARAKPHETTSPPSPTP